MPLSDVGPYRVLRLLKEGGEGTVYIAEDSRLGRRVALKLRPLPAEQSARSLAIAEAETLASLNHPLIVQLYDLVELPEALALVMEYVDGEDLEELLSLASLDLHTVLQLGIDVCTALAAAHELGIVHGDLKPANILVDKRGHIKLADFGIAGRPGLRPELAGSLAALTPEQVAGEVPNSAADLFALGCLLYRMTVGRHPFVRAEFTGRPAAGFRQLSVPVVEDLHAANPPPLASLVGQLLKEDPVDRPASALQVRQALLAISRDYPAGSSAVLADLVREAKQNTAAADPVAQEPVGAFQKQADEGGRSRWHIPWLGRFLVASLALFLVFVLWQKRWPGPEAPVYLVLEPLELDGYPASAVLAPPELLELLRLEAAEYRRVNLVEQVDDTGGPAGKTPEHLLLKIRCNAHVCSSQLVRQAGLGPARVNMMAMLPDATRSDWRVRIVQGLEDLFPASTRPVATD